MVGQLYLRTPDEKVYGPVDMVTLCAWATDARIIPGCALSEDRTTWRGVETFPELRLNWLVQLPDGSSYGPLNLLAVWALAQEKNIPLGLPLTDTSTRRTAQLNDSLSPLLIEESRIMLSAAGQLAAGIMTVLGAGQEHAGAEIKARDDRLAGLQAKVAALEQDLSINARLLGESQRFLAQHGEQSQSIEAHLRETATLGAELERAQAKLTELQRRCDMAERDSAELEGRRRDLDDTRAKLAGVESEYAVAVSRLHTAEQEARSAREALEAQRTREADLQARLAELTSGQRDLQASLERVRDDAASHRARAEALEAAVAQATAEREEAATRVQRAEQEAAQTRNECETVLQREAALREQLTLQSSGMQATLARITEELEQEKAARKAGEGERDALIAALRQELAQWDGKFKAALSGVLKMESSLQDREQALTLLQRQAERTEADLSARVHAARKDIEQANRRAQEWKQLCEEAQREAKEVRERGALIAQELREELAAVQRDYSSMTADPPAGAAPGPGTPHPGHSINWLDGARGKRGAGGPASSQESMAARLQESMEERESLRLTIKRLRDEQETQLRDLQARMAQVQQEARTSSGLVQQALEELERREAQIRAMRKKAEEREQELLGRIELLESTERDTVVVEPEVIAPGAWAPPGDSERGPANEPAEALPQGAGLLNSVEAQLRSELQEWEALNRRKSEKRSRIRQWFGRNSS